MCGNRDRGLVGTKYNHKLKRNLIHLMFKDSYAIQKMCHMV